MLLKLHVGLNKQENKLNKYNPIENYFLKPIGLDVFTCIKFYISCFIKASNISYEFSNLVQ